MGSQKRCNKRASTQKSRNDNNHANFPVDFAGNSADQLAYPEHRKLPRSKSPHETFQLERVDKPLSRDHVLLGLVHLLQPLSTMPMLPVRYCVPLCILHVACNGQIGSIDPDSTTPGTASLSLSEAPIRRLTPEEYRQSVIDIFGVDLNTSSVVLPDDGRVRSFDNNASQQTTTVRHAQSYQHAAEFVSTAVLADSQLRSNLAGCDPAAAWQSCTDAFISRITRRAYRRAPSTEEIQVLSNLALSLQNDPDPWAGIGIIIEALLQQSAFLFRTEIGMPDPDDSTRVKLTPYEIATRLSFGLWSTTPDDWLLRVAEGLEQDAGLELESADGVAVVAAQMLEDPRSQIAAQNFGLQWLQTYSLDETDKTLGMENELSLLLGDFLRKGSSVLDIFQSQYTYLNEDLANLYGIGGVVGSDFQKVSVDVSSGRGGVFTTAAFFRINDFGDKSLIHRGKYVRQAALCETPPPPPPGVEGLVDFATADRLATPECRGCHIAMDPIGYGLEQYDITGAYDESQALAQLGWIEGIAGSEFEGGRALGTIVSGAESAPRCFVENFSTWFYGNVPSAEDSPYIEQISQNFKDNQTHFDTLIDALVRSDTFRYRSVGVSQ